MYPELPTAVFQKQGLKRDNFYGSCLRNLSMKFYISLVFEKCATNFTPHFSSKNWRKWPKFLQEMGFFYTFEDYHLSVRENWHMSLETLLSIQDLSPMLNIVLICT